VWSVAEAVRCRREDDCGSWLPRKCIAETALRKLGEEIGSARRHTGTEHAETRKEFEIEKVVSCSSGGQRRRTKLDLESRELLDDHHRATTLGAAPKFMRVAGG
jgi:hypothetical protein